MVDGRHLTPFSFLRPSYCQFKLINLIAKPRLKGWLIVEVNEICFNGLLKKPLLEMKFI
jgi:hypothetical protein